MGGSESVEEGVARVDRDGSAGRGSGAKAVVRTMQAVRAVPDSAGWHKALRAARGGAGDDDDKSRRNMWYAWYIHVWYMWYVWYVW